MGIMIYLRTDNKSAGLAGVQWSRVSCDGCVCCAVGLYVAVLTALRT